MRKTWKKVTSAMMAAAMVTGMLSGCAKTESGTTATTGSAPEETTAAAGTAGTAEKISFLNSKGEIQAALEEMAAVFEKEKGIKVEIMACGAGEVPYTRITSMYNSGTAPTMAMLDTTDIVALATEYALDLSDQEWIAQCEDKVTKVDGKVYSFPFCVEGRGIIYNKAAIETTLGKTFDPNSINSYSALKGILEELRSKGMENPVVVSKEDWSLGAHQLGFIYDTYDGTTVGAGDVIGQLKDGSLKAEDYNRFNDFMATLDLLLQYNINGKDPLGALYEQDPIFLADKEAAFWLNGNWAWPNLVDAGAEEADGYGFIPWVLGDDTSDFANNQIQAAASKQVMIDKKQATPEEQAAAKEFLNWIVNGETGQKMLVEDCALIPACVNNKVEPVDPLGKDIKAKMAESKTFSSSFIAPGDHWSVMGAQLQKYMAGQSTKADVATALNSYWTSQK